MSSGSTDSNLSYYFPTLAYWPRHMQVLNINSDTIQDKVAMSIYLPGYIRFVE